MMKYLLCFVLIFGGYTYVKGSENSRARIVGGSTTNIISAKFTVNLRLNGEFMCGGSLIAPQIVITAAHCVYDVQPSQLTVVGGVTYLSESGVRRSVSKIIIPKEYIHGTHHPDIAVLKLSGNMSGNNIETIELCKANWKLGDYIDIYGWGTTSETFIRKTNQIRTIKVPLLTHKRCSDMYEAGGGKITQTMFCAGDLKGKDSCVGDSGGPAVFKNQLCGVVSWGMGCARTNFPGVYTNIKTVRNFIDRAIKM